MPRYTILLFGPAAVAADEDHAVIDSPVPCSVGELNAMIARQYPQLTELLEVGRLAVNQSFVSEDTQIDQNDEVALITMVSGG